MILDWFKIKGRSLSGLSFSLHRITGIILLIYLVLHLTFLTSLRYGKDIYHSLIEKTVQPATLPLDLLLILATFYHAFNGMRVILHEFGLAVELRKVLIYITYALTIIFWIYASYIMYKFVVG